MPLVPRTQSLAAKPPPRVTLLLTSRHYNLVSYLVPVSQKGRRRRHMEASYWTAASDVASTSAPVKDLSTAVNGGQPLVNDRSMTAGPPADGGQWRRSTAVNGGGPPEHRRTTGQRWWLTRSWAGSGSSEKEQEANLIFFGELDFIDLILPGIDEDNFDEDDFDEEEGEIDDDILKIEDEILREKLLNVNILIDKIEALNLTPSIPFVLEYPSSSHIAVVDNDFLIEEVDTFLIPEDSIPPGIESDFDSEGDIIFSNDLLNDDHIPEYERFTFDIEPDAPVINNFDELNEDECFDPGGGEDCLDFKGSRARCFVHRSLAIQSLACLYWESDILNLID
ncbi:hypothetical protein Tco_1548508 [Tanacetum coccineum]